MTNTRLTAARWLLAFIALLSLTAGLIAPATATAAPAPLLASAPTYLSIGDSYTAGVGDHNPEDGKGWSPILAEQMGWQLTQAGIGGSGYVNEACFPNCGGIFASRVWKYRATPYDHVILQGSNNDKSYIGQYTDGRWNTSKYAGAVNSTLRAAVTFYGASHVVVVGPVYPNGNTDAYELKLRDVQQRMAAANGVRFIDPIAEGWFPPGSTLYRQTTEPGMGHPNQAGYARFASELAADLS